MNRPNSNWKSKKRIFGKNRYIKKAFCAGSKYINFLKFSNTCQNLWAGENLSKFRKRGKTAPKSPVILINCAVRFNIPENPIVVVSSSNLRKYEILRFLLAEEGPRIHVYFFAHGMILLNQLSYKINREFIRTGSKSPSACSELLLSLEGT